MKTIRTINTNSSLFPVIEFGQYGSFISLGERAYDEIANDISEGIYPEGTDIKDCDEPAYMMACAELAADLFNDYIEEHAEDLAPYGLKRIKATGTWSPRYYNYSNDRMEMDVEIETEAANVVEYIQSHRARIEANPACAAYIEDNWKSRSGFLSFMPEDIDEVFSEDYIVRDQDRALSALLTLALVDAGMITRDSHGLWSNELQEPYEYGVYEDISAFEYYEVDAPAEVAAA